MKVFIQIIDTNDESYQCAIVNELVKKGSEFTNALGHFGIKASEIKVDVDTNNYFCGKVENSSKIFTCYLL